MPTDANGNERKGIEVLCRWSRTFTVPIRGDVVYASESAKNALAYFRTVRDLMRAGF